MKLPASSRPQFIFMIGDDGVFFIPYKVPGEARPFFVAEGDAQGIAAIFSALARNPRVPLALFADTLAQDFRREVLPRLNPLDRPKVVARRLQQAFPQAGLAASLNLAQGRTHILLAGIHKDGPVFDWLERLKNHRRDMTPCIALVPVECASMVARLLPDAAEGWALLLSRQRTGGFRQIVTHKGELVFTRLTPPLPFSAGAREIAETVLRDIKASLGYLGRLGLTDPAQLQAVLLLPESTHEALGAVHLPVGTRRFLTPHKAAQDMELPFLPEPDEACSDLLYAGWLARKRKPRLSLMPPDMKKTRQTALIKKWGWRAAAVSLLLAFGMTGWQAGDLVNTLLETRQEAAQLAALKQKLADEQATAAPVTEPLGRLRQAIERRRLFSEPVATPWAALQALGRGIGNEVRLVKFVWRSEDGKPVNEAMQIDVRLVPSQFSSPQGGGDSGDFPVDRQATAARFQKLAQNVAQAMPGYDVRLTRYPFPALPDEALSNDGAAKNDRNADDTAELTVRKVSP